MIIYIKKLDFLRCLLESILIVTMKFTPILCAPLGQRVARWLARWQPCLPLGLTIGLPQLLRAGDHVDYRYGYYDETGNRMKVETFSVYFEQKLIDSVIAKGELTYDGVSGATPVGTHYQGQAVLVSPPMFDIRRAANIEIDGRIGNQTLTPGFAYSEEHDYQSYGVSLNDAIEFNDKNTILQLGLSHNFDSVRDGGRVNWHEKNSTEGIIGVSQLLSPKDILNVAFTFGNDSGYLKDPYRFAEFHRNGSPINSTVGVSESRPSHRNKEILFTSLTHHFDSFNASLEGSYRFYHDSYGVSANTLGLTWHQWLSKHFIIEPLFRFSEQSAADFYTTTFSGPGIWLLPNHSPPGFYSSDYRLSEMYTLDYGLQATLVINDHMRFVAGYHRYEMNGLDKTTADMYPKANVYSVGFSILW